MDQPIYGLASLYLYPYYQTREDYQRVTGREPPPWTPLKSPKYWEDPKALTSVRPTVTYDVIAMSGSGSGAIPDAAGNPQYDTLALSRKEAAVVNIPPNATNVEGAGEPMIPPPVRKLQPWERLQFGFGGVVQVRNTQVQIPGDPGAALPELLDLARRIAAKLGA